MKRIWIGSLLILAGIVVALLPLHIAMTGLCLMGYGVLCLADWFFEKKGWKRGKNEPVKNVDLWKRLLRAKEPHSASFHWVKGHDGHPQNERCDELATSAADGDALLVDEGAGGF